MYPLITLKTENYVNTCNLPFCDKSSPTIKSVYKLCENNMGIGCFGN